jgi:hypothetical protein
MVHICISRKWKKEMKLIERVISGFQTSGTQLKTRLAKERWKRFPENGGAWSIYLKLKRETNIKRVVIDIACPIV